MSADHVSRPAGQPPKITINGTGPIPATPGKPKKE